MGNRSYLYTTDKLPVAIDSDEAAPSICHEVGSGNNCLPPLWRVLFSTAAADPAQDFQQIFLPSVCGGIYAERGLAEQRLFALLDFMAEHPMLSDPHDFRRKTAGLRQYLATLSGLAYSADLNEYFMLGGDELSGDAQLEKFMRRCTLTWHEAEQAMERDDYAGVEKLYNINPRDIANSLGFACWSHDYFAADDDTVAEATFDEYCAGQERQREADGGEPDYVGHDLYRYTEQGKVGLCREDRTPVLPALYDEICDFDHDLDLASLRQNDLWGICDANGRIVLEPVLSELYEFNERTAVARLGERYGYLDSKGRWLLKPRYDDAFDFSSGLAAVVMGGLTGYVNQLGCEVIAPRFLDDSGSFLEHGQAAVQTAQGYGVIDRAGAFVIPARHAAIDWQPGLDAWQASGGDGQQSLYFADGSAWFAGAYDSIDHIPAAGDALVQRNALFGTIRRDGSAGIPIAYADIELLAEAGNGPAGLTPALYAVTSTEGLTGACLPDGTLLAPLAYANIGVIAFSGDELESAEAAEAAIGLPQLLRIEREGDGLGVWSIDAQREVLPCEYGAVQAFACGRQLRLLAHDALRGYVVSDAGGRLLGEQPYEWLLKDYYGAAEGWQMVALGRSIGRDWSQGTPVYGWRDNQGWRLYPDGREESELRYQMRRAFDKSGAPTIPRQSRLKGLLDVVRRKRNYVIAGTTNPDACNAVADIHAYGYGVGIDQAKACRFYASAAAGGNKEALYQYGYYLMQGLGCEADAAAARRQFEALVPENKRALNCLAYLYEYRLGDAIDTVRARAMYLEAAEGGEWGLALAQNNAGNCWRYGVGGPVDQKIALDYYELAAKSCAFPPRDGNPDACRSAAELYCEQAAAAQAAGQPKEQKRTLQRAMYFYKQMPEHGLDEGHVGLARCFLGEFGGRQNLDAARAQLRLVLQSGECGDQARDLWKRYQLG